MTLHLTTPSVVTAALDRALSRRGAQRDLSRAIGLPQPAIARATDPRQGDNVSLARVAAAADYERHPSMPGHYRRRHAAATVATADPTEA